MLYLLQQGREKIEELGDATKRHGFLTEQGAERARELQTAFTGLTQSVTGFSNVIADNMSRWMTPMLMQWSTWLDKARETPDLMKKVELGIDALATVFGVTAVAGVAKLIAKLNAFWALPILKYLIANPWLAGLLAGGAVMAPGATNSGEQEYIRQHPELFPRPRPRHGELRWLNPQERQRRVERARQQQGQSDEGRLTPHSAAVENLTHNNVGNIRARGGGWQSYDSPEAGIRAVGNWLSRWYARGKDTLEKLISTYSPSSENDTEALIQRASKALNIDRHAHIDPNDPALRARLVAAFIRNEHGGRLPPGYTDSQIAAALAGDAGPPATGEHRRRSIWGSLRDSVAPSAAAGLPEVPHMTLPDVKVTPTKPPVPTVGPSTGGAAGGPQTFNLDSNSKHEVFIDIRGAAPGMRTGLTRAEGPAEVAVRTHYSLDSLS